MVKFFLQKFAIFNVIIDSILVKKWETLERTCFNIYQVAYKWRII